MQSSEAWPGDRRSSEDLRDPMRAVLEPCGLGIYQYQLDPYAGCGHQCCYCYALVREGGGWSEEVEWYDDLAGRLAVELRDLEPQTIYLGWNSDPYQPAEAETMLMREVLGVLARKGFSASILTKSDLVLRDLDVLTRMPEPSVGVSLAFVDEEVRSLFEPHACSTARRIAALERLRASGIATFALICPVIPFLTDVEALVRAVAPHADGVWVYGLRVAREQDPNWRRTLAVVRSRFPARAAQIERIVLDAEHPFWSEQRAVLARLACETRLDLRVEL